MKSFKKIFPVLCLVFGLLVLISPMVSSAAGSPSTGPSGALKKLQEVGGTAYGVDVTKAPTPLATVIGNIVQTFLSILGIVAAVLMIYGGYLWMTGRGKEERINKAKETLEAAIIGLIIIMAAYAITYFVVDHFLTATGTTAPASTDAPPPT
jgi:hypothetical protein